VCGIETERETERYCSTYVCVCALSREKTIEKEKEKEPLLQYVCVFACVCGGGRVGAGC